MAFVLETGDGVADANAYCSLAFARDHHETRGQLADWDGDDVTTAITAADATANTVTVAGHPFETGDGPVRLTGTDLPAPLATGTDYWLVAASSSALKLATSLADAIAEAPIVVDLSDVGSGAQAIVHPDFDAQRVAIVLATDYVENLYAHRFHGTKGSAEQGLHFPADGIYDPVAQEAVTGVPVAAKRAIAEYALRARTAELAPDSNGGAVASESKTSGPISKSVSYAAPVNPSLRSYPAADRWLRSLLRPTTAVRA